MNMENVNISISWLWSHDLIIQTHTHTMHNAPLFVATNHAWLTVAVTKRTAAGGGVWYSVQYMAFSLKCVMVDLSLVVYNWNWKKLPSIAVLVKSTALHCNGELSMIALEFHCQIFFSVGVISFYASKEVLKALN